MKIYSLIGYDYDDVQTFGIFSSLELAQAQRLLEKQKHGERYYLAITEHAIDLPGAGVEKL